MLSFLIMNIFFVGHKEDKCKYMTLKISCCSTWNDFPQRYTTGATKNLSSLLSFILPRGWLLYTCFDNPQMLGHVVRLWRLCWWSPWARRRPSAENHWLGLTWEGLQVSVWYSIYWVERETPELVSQYHSHMSCVKSSHGYRHRINKNSSTWLCYCI